MHTLLLLVKHTVSLCMNGNNNSTNGGEKKRDKARQSKQQKSKWRKKDVSTQFAFIWIQSRWYADWKTHKIGICQQCAQSGCIRLHILLYTISVQRHAPILITVRSTLILIKFKCFQTNHLHARAQKTPRKAQQRKVNEKGTYSDDEFQQDLQKISHVCAHSIFFHFWLDAAKTLRVGDTLQCIELLMHIVYLIILFCIDSVIGSNTSRCVCASLYTFCIITCGSPDGWSHQFIERIVAM